MLRLLSRLIHSRRLYAVVALLLGISAFNLYLFRHDFAQLVSQATGEGKPDVERWQRWARHYDQLFGMLPWNERIGIQLEGQQGSGLILERTSSGMVAWRSSFLRRERPGVILIFDQGAATRLLATVPETPAGEIWQMVKELLYNRLVTVWSDPDLDRLQKRGYLAFLRAIDTRPRDVTWETVRERLGESRKKP